MNTPLNPEDIRLLLDVCRRVKGLRVGPGLTMTNGPTGINIGLAPVREYRTEASASGGSSLLNGKITAVVSTSNAPPMQYTVDLGYWKNPSGISPGTWTASGGTVMAYAETPDMIPQLADTYVTLFVRGRDTSGIAYYTIIGPSGTFDVYLEQTGGSNGVASTDTAATWTYDVYIDSGKTIQIATAAAVVAPRMLNVDTVKATRGIARINGTTVTLLQAFEKFTICAV